MTTRTVTLTPVYDVEQHDGVDVAGDPIEWEAWVRPCGAGPKTLPLILLMWYEPHEPLPWCVYVGGGSTHYDATRAEAEVWINEWWEDAPVPAKRGRHAL
jgi:hypothetical protein